MKSQPIYKTAEELGIAQREHDGLVALIGPLSREELPIDMHCGTACCIGGYVSPGEKSEQGHAAPGKFAPSLLRLYFPDSGPHGWMEECLHPAWKATAPQAATAIINFLMGMGDKCWDFMREPSA